MSDDKCRDCGGVDNWHHDLTVCVGALKSRIAALEAELADVRTLLDWLKLDEGNQVVIEHINARHYITLWPEGEVCTGESNENVPQESLAVAAALVREKGGGK